MNEPLSYTRISLLEQCPARFKAQYYDGIKPKATDAMRIGSYAHAVLEAYLRHLKAQGLPTDYRQYDVIFETKWREWVADGAISPYLKAEAWLVGQATKESILVAEGEEIIGVEVSLAVDEDWHTVDYDDPKAFVRGRIDSIWSLPGGKTRLDDYKSGHRIEAADATMQLPLYLAMYVQDYGFGQAPNDDERIWLRQINGRLRKSREVAADRETLLSARDWVRAAADSIVLYEKDGFPETPGSGCAECPVFNSCKKAKETASELPARSEDEARRLLERLVLIERERKDLFERLKVWAGANGAVAVGGMEAAFRVKGIYQYDPRLLEPILQAEGHDIRKVLKVDNKALDKLVKGDEVLKRKLAGIAKDRSTSEFRIKRRGEDDE